MENSENKRLINTNSMLVISLLMLIFLVFSSLFYPSVFYGNWPYILILLFLIIFSSVKDKKVWGVLLLILFLSSMVLMQALFYFIIPMYNNYQPTPTLPLMKMFNIDGKFQVSYYPDIPKGGDNMLLYLDMCTLDSSNCTKCDVCSLSGYFTNEKNEEKFLFENISLNNTHYIQFTYPGRRVNVMLDFEGIDRRYNTFYIPKLNIWETIIVFSEEHPIFRILSLFSLIGFVISLFLTIRKGYNPTKTKIISILNKIKNSKIMKNIKILFKKIFQELKDFYGNYKNIDLKKLGEIGLFVFISIFFAMLLVFSMEMLKIITEAGFENTFISIIKVFLSLIFLYLIVSFYLFQTIKKEYAPYFIAIISIFFFYLIPLSKTIKIILYIVMFLLILPDIYNNWKKPKWFFLSTLLIILITFLLGISVIHGIYGVQKTTITFIDCSNNQRVPSLNMSCFSNDKQELIAEYLTFCNIDPSIENLSGYVDFRYANGTKSNEQYFNETISFVSPQQLRDIHFRIYANHNESPMCLDTTWSNIRFPTYEEAQINKDKLLAYFFGLLAVLVVTIPLAILNFRKIWNESQ